MRAALVGFGMEPLLREDAVLVVSELVGNSVRHARPRSDGSLLLQWRVGDDELVVEVSDGGAPTLPELRRPDPDAPSGRGLAIVNALSQGWGARRQDGGLTVWARLKPGGRSANRPARDRGQR